LVLGVLVAFLSPVEYESEIVLMPEQPSAPGGGASNLLKQFGLGAVSIPKDLPYFDPYYFSYVVNSSSFHSYIMKQKISFVNLDSAITFYEYFNQIARPSPLGLIKNYTIGLPGTIKRNFFTPNQTENIIGENFKLDSSIIKFSEEEQALAEIVNDRIVVDVEEPTGITTISTEMPDPVAAADLARIAKEFLTEFSTAYATDKVKENLKFVEKQYQKAKRDFYNAQNALASFRDRNINVTTARAKTEEERLQNEYQIAYEVYLGLAQQLEQAKMKVQEQTPVFSVLKPAKVPLEKSKPKRLLLLIVFLFLGLFSGVGVVFGKMMISNFANDTDIK